MTASARYSVKRMSRLLFGDTPVWGVADSRRVIVVFTSYELAAVEAECARLNGMKEVAQCAS